MRVNLARLNHVFIPATKEGRDRIRRRLLVRSVRPLIWLYFALSDEGRFLAITSVLVGMTGIEVQSTSIYLFWCVMAAPLLVSFLFRGPFSLVGQARLDVRAPRRVAVAEECRFTLTLTSEGPRSFDAVRVRGPMLPWDGRFLGAPPRDVSLDAGGSRQVTLDVAFLERGEHHLDPFFAGALVPLGLVVGRVIESPACRITVVPRIANIRSLSTPRAQRHQPGGVALASRTGESMDLLGVRPYRPGDPVRDLHARTSARLGAPHVREYQQEYFSRFGVLLDTQTDPADPERFEAAISLAAGIVAHLSRGEGLIDLLVCGRQLHPLTLGRSLGQLEQALDLLASVQPEEVFDADALLSRLSPFLDRLSCVLLVWLSWDETRLRFLQRLQHQLPCRVFVLSPHELPSSLPDALRVDPGAVQEGHPLLL
jgi:uncharacterized protein (DUF58 family)